MDAAGINFLGIGIYSVSEASRLTGVPARTIRRWAMGYRFTTGTGRHTSAPLWAPELPPLEGRVALGFRDLIEVRVIQALLGKDISWHRIRRIGSGMARILNTDHPFSTAKFKTDGYHIYADLPKPHGRGALVEPESFQLALRKIIEPFLSDLEFGDGGGAARWWPLGKKDKSVVIDPQRAFGRPIINSAGVPTAVLAAAYQAEGQDADVVAHWYDLPKAAVLKAVAFERRLAA